MEKKEGKGEVEVKCRNQWLWLARAEERMEGGRDEEKRREEGEWRRDWMGAGTQNWPLMESQHRSLLTQNYVYFHHRQIRLDQNRKQILETRNMFVVKAVFQIAKISTFKSKFDFNF